MIPRGTLNKHFVKNLSIAMSVLVLTTPAYVFANAATGINIKVADAGQNSVLLPGARLVAGDPAKNEFYILGKEEKANAPKPVAAEKVAMTSPAAMPSQETSHPAPNKAIQNVINKKDMHDMQSALNAAIDEELSKQTIGYVKDKTKNSVPFQPSFQTTHKRTISKIQLALNKTLKPKTMTATSKHSLHQVVLHQTNTTAQAKPEKFVIHDYKPDNTVKVADKKSKKVVAVKSAEKKMKVPSKVVVVKKVKSTHLALNKTSHR